MKTFLNFHSFYWVRGWGTPGGPCKGGSNEGGFGGAAREGKDFFDEFSTALLFFLILKKAFFVVFYAVCQKRKNWEIMRKPLLFFPGKIVSIVKLKIKISWWHFQFFFFWSNQKNFFQPRKEPTLNVCIFFTLFYSFFFLRVGVLFLFWTQALQAVLKEAFFFFYERCVFWAGGAGVKIRQKSCFLCRGFLL